MRLFTVQLTTVPPPRVLLATPTPFAWAASVSGLEYRYKLDVPGDWKAGVRYILNKWTPWGTTQSITYSDFIVAGKYTFSIQARDPRTGQESKAVSYDFSVYFEMPELFEEAVQIDWAKARRAPTKKQQYEILAQEFQAAHRAWLQKLDYQQRLLKSSVDIKPFIQKLVPVPTDEAAGALLEWVDKGVALSVKLLLAPKTLYDLLQVAGVDLILIFRRAEANKAASMALLTYYGWKGYERLAQLTPPMSVAAPQTPPPPASTLPATPQPDPQFLAQVQQMRSSWERLTAQANQVAYPTPTDRTAVSQDLQRVGQALQTAEAAAQRGDQAAAQAQLAQAQQALAAASQRLTRLAESPPQQLPVSPSSPGTNRKQFGDPLEEFREVRAYSRGECTGNPPGIKSPNKRNLMCEEDITFQCVDYVKRFYSKIGEIQTEWGTAWRFWQRGEYRELTRFPNGKSTDRPQTGDLLFFQEVNGNGGHVAIVTDSTQNSVRVIHQNVTRDTALGEIALSRVGTGSYQVGALKGMPAVGWLRVKSSSAVQNRPPVARIDATAAGQRAQEGQELRVTAPAGGEVAVTLSAARSQDPEGRLARFVWESVRQILGTDREVTRSFRAGTHEVTLTVRDAEGATAQAQVRVVVAVSTTQNLLTAIPAESRQVVRVQGKDFYVVSPTVLPSWFKSRAGDRLPTSWIVLDAGGKVADHEMTFFATAVQISRKPPGRLQCFQAVLDGFGRLGSLGLPICCPS